MQYKESDLILNVSKNVDLNIWDEEKYSIFLDILFQERDYQKEATKTALRYMNSGEYSSLHDLALENFKENSVIRERYNNNYTSFENDLGLPDKLSATIDLATATGKSYVMYAIALIMLAEQKTDRVLVLAPSVTIERELTDKFNSLVNNEQLNYALGSEFELPSIINGDETIVKNSIAIENRDAIYQSQEFRNSILDSLKGNGESTLVLNDEVHHVFYSENNEWKKFIKDERENDINFRYVLGFTGTAYKKKSSTGDSNDYFSDVIYRYSLRDAIEQNHVKDVYYVDRDDMPQITDERWQVILNRHDNLAKELDEKAGIIPITIIVNAGQRRADAQAKKFKEFLMKQRNLSKEEVDNIVLSVHSGSNAAKDRSKLLNVDTPGNPVEFIFSVSMLTEGWDVKRVFQIVPDEERAFNSKLLIAQVLGRGLRKPEGWLDKWGIPTVTVFNHERWAPRVKVLVDELLDFKKSITTTVNEKSEYNFDLINVSYTSKPVSKKTTQNAGVKNFFEQGYVNLPTDLETKDVKVEFRGIVSEKASVYKSQYSSDVYTISQVANQMHDRFDDLPDEQLINEYKKEWSVEKLEEMIKLSLTKSSNKVITRNLKNAFINSLNVIFRSHSKSISYDSIPSDYHTIKTISLPRVTTDLSTLKKNKVLYYSDELERADLDDLSKASLSEIKNNNTGYRYKKIDNKYLFKTPQYGVVTTGEPEEKFITRLTDADVARKITAFVKSTDFNFYSIDYTWRKGSHQKNGKFNPDLFIKIDDKIIVVEIKDDSQILDPDQENIGKYKASENHFQIINSHLQKQGKNERYKFTFLTPKNYSTFFDKLLSENASEILNFRSELDVTLKKVNI